MADDLSLLFKIRGDSAGAKTAVAETRAAVATLRGSLGSDFTAMQSASKNALAAVGDNLNVFVGQRIPLIGGAFVRVTENLRGFGDQTKNTEQGLAKLSNTIQGLAKETGKTTGQLTSFLTKFVQLETQAKRDTAAIEFLGAAAAQKLIPALEKAGAELSTVAASSETAGASIAGMAGPIAVAVVAIAAAALGVTLLQKKLIDLARSTAEFEGKMFDLSQQTGVNVETLSALEIIARTTGGSIESIAQSLVIFQGKLDEAQDITSKAGRQFVELGISTRSTEEAFRDALTVLAAMPEGFKQTNDAAELFGRRGGKQVLAVLKETQGDLDGTIKKFRDLGILISTEDARAADEFNDQLAILQFQLRALGATIGEEVIPVLLGGIKDLSKALKDNREAINAVATAAGFLTTSIMGPLKLAVTAATLAWTLSKPTLDAVADTYERIAKAVAFITRNPFSPAPTVKPEVGGEAETSGVIGGPTLKQLQLRIQAQRELQGFQAATAEDAKRIGENVIKDAERQFQIGQIGRAEQLKGTLAGLKRIRDAELNGIEQQRRLKLDELALAEKQNVDTAAAINELATLDGRKRAAEAKFFQESKEAKAKARADELKATQDHNDAILKTYLDASADRIKTIEDELLTAGGIRENAALQINAIEAEQLRRRQENLEKQLALPQIELELRKRISAEIAAISKNVADIENQQIEDLLKKATQAALDVEAQIAALQEIDFTKRREELTGDRLRTTDLTKQKRIDDQLKALEIEFTEAQRLQAARRNQITQTEADTRAAILFGNAADIQRLGAASDAARIESLDVLASARVNTEKETARAISEIQRLAIERDASAFKSAQLRQRQQELTQQLENLPTETEARKRVNAELAKISQDRINIEKRQIEDLLQTATRAALDADAQIKALQDTDLGKRKDDLTGQKARAADLADQEQINGQLVALDAERTEAEREQSVRRKQITQDEADIRAALLTGNIEEARRIGAASDEAILVSLKNLATARVIAEGETARAIEQVRLRASERETATIKAEQLRREEAFEQQLALPQLELEVRKKINAELATVSKNLAKVEREQIEGLLRAATQAAIDAEERIAALRDVDFKKREAVLTTEKQQTTDPAEVQKINDQLQALNTKRTEAERQQAVRRKQIFQDESDTRTAILSGNADEIQRIGAASDTARIADLQTLATAQIRTAEETASAVSQIQHEAAERDLAIRQADKQRLRQTELRAALADANLEIETRKTLSTELAAISQGLVVGGQKQIQDLQFATQIALDAAVEIAALQEDLFRKRAAALTEEKQKTTDPAELTRINEQLKALDVERTESERQEAAKRTQIAQDEADLRTAIVSGNADEARRKGAAIDAARIADLKTLAAALVFTEEDTVKAIGQIHRDAEAREAAITKADRLRRRQEELKETLQGAALELGARKKLNTELSVISTTLLTGEREQLASLQTAVSAAVNAEIQIAALQEAGLRRRESALTKEKETTTDPAELKRVNDQLAALDIERTHSEKEQAARREEVMRAEAIARAAIASGSADEIKRTGAAVDAATVASLKALSGERIRGEAETSRAILEIHRDAEARDAAATKTSRLRERQEQLRHQLEGTQLELTARQRLNEELERVATERAGRERGQVAELLKTATEAAAEAEARLKVLQDTVSKRKGDLTGEKLRTTDPAEIKRINAQIAALDVTRTQNEQQQSAFRAQNAQAEAELRAKIVSGSFKTVREIGIVSDKIRTDSQKALAAAGVVSAEETAKAISEIKHDAEIRDAEITKTDRLRRREEEIRQILQGGDLEVEARKSINAELAQIARDLANVEKRQVEDLIKVRTASALKAERDIKKIEDDALDAREVSLKKRLSDPIDVVARQAIVDQLKALGVERTETERQQELRITQIHRDEAQTRLEILAANAEAILALDESADAGRIASIKGYVALRVKTEEQAERDILAVKLRAADREIDALRIEQTKAGAFKDLNERAKQLAAINNAIKAAAAARAVIEDQGNRDIEEKRQKDLENERKYADELLTIQQRTLEAQRKTDQLVIDALVLQRAPQSQIIAAQLKLDLASLKTRHDAIQKSIDKDKSDTDERVAILTKLIQALEDAGQRETDVYQTAVNELATANAKKQELHAEEEEELRRTEEEKKAIRKKALQDEAAASPLSALLTGLETGQLAALENGVQSFRDVAIVAFSAVGAAVGQLAQGIGALIQNWVLMGETGPNAFRKLAATILASIAQQAAVLAIMSLAYAALSTTVVGAILLGGTPGQFLAAAALFGAVAVGTAIAGRAIAGDTFKPKTESATPKAAPEKPTGPPQPRDIDRRSVTPAPAPAPIILQPIVNVTMTGQATEGFKYVVERALVESVRGNGVMRKIQNGETV